MIRMLIVPVLGFTLLMLVACAAQEAPPLAVPMLDPFMARKVSIDAAFKDSLVFNGAQTYRLDSFGVTVNILNRSDKPQHCFVKWVWIDNTGMKLSPGRRDLPQELDIPGRQSVPIKIFAPQPGVDDWKMFVTRGR